MDSPSVKDRIFQAVRNGSIEELRQLFSDKETILANLSEKDDDERTPLLVAIKEKQFEIIDFLVKTIKDNINIEGNVRSQNIRKMSLFSWSKVDVDMFSIGPPEKDKEFTQTFVCPSSDTEIIRDIANQISVLKLMEYLIDLDYDDVSWFEFVTNSFITSSMPRPEKIIALELMGAAFVIKELLSEIVWEEHTICVRGLQCWEKAFELRNSITNGRLPIPKILQPLSDVARKAIGDVIEGTVPLQLKEMQEHLTYRDSPSMAFAQALLVILRTFGQRDIEHSKPNYFHLKTLLEYGKHIPDDGSIRLINVCLLILEHLNNYNGNDSPKCLQIFVEAFLLYSDVIVRLEKIPANSTERREELTFTNLLAAIKFGSIIVTKLMFHPPPISIQIQDNCYSVVQRTYALIITVFKLHRPDRGEIERLNQVLGGYFRIEKRRKGFTSFLHMAVEKFLETSIDDELMIAVEVIQLFIDNGADPRIIDCDGKTPLHLLAERCSPDCKEPYYSVFEAVLEGGGHLDQVTADGVTVLKILQEKKKQLISGEVLDPRIDAWTNAILLLQCYSAQSIPPKIIMKSTDVFPPNIQEFLAQHHKPLVLQQLPLLPPRFPSGYRVAGFPR
ncbi:protein fem-1 homolog A-A-like [Daphnia magna]|uniref:protein fem-1 homolog A-A-like n=1 Tax=Daphnia magna TaxID=35525 RepID=UPI001E1BA458|nr:protein fem-1 homolog A-A-like [Daphnia magna]